MKLGMGKDFPIIKQERKTQIFTQHEKLCQSTLAFDSRRLDLLIIFNNTIINLIQVRLCIAF